MKVFNIQIIFTLLFILKINAAENEEQDVNLNEDINEKGPIQNGIVENLIKGALDPFDPFYIPFLPTIGFNPDPTVDFSFVLTDINITGLTDLDVKNVDLGEEFTMKIIFNNLLMRVGDYSAGGHIINVPFNGESYMVASLQGLTLDLALNFSTFDIDIVHQNESVFCAVENSTKFFMEIRKPVIYFDNLNPGTDQGLLLNTMLSSAIFDLIDQLSVALNGGLHDAFDGLLVGLINNLACTDDSTTTESPTSTSSPPVYPHENSLEKKFVGQVKEFIKTFKN